MLNECENVSQRNCSHATYTIFLPLCYPSTPSELNRLIHIKYWYRKVEKHIGGMEKEHKNTNAFCLKVLGKLHILMQTAEIGFLFLKLLRFYVFKMAANGDCHFERNIKLKNYQIKFISQKHAYSYTVDKHDLYYANNHFMGLFYEFCTFIRHYWK